MMKLIGSVLDVLFPRLCCVCGAVMVQSERYLCDLCLYKLPNFQVGDASNNAITRMFWGRVNVVHGISLYRFSRRNTVSKLIFKMKYGQSPAMARLMGELLGKKLLKLQLKFSAVVFVPLHRKKKKIRGYDQCALIAEGIADVTAWPVHAVLKRVRHSESQTRLGRYHRYKNIEGSYALYHHNLQGHVLVVDDVITTGATLEACVRCLLEIEGVECSVASIATTLR